MPPTQAQRHTNRDTCECLVHKKKLGVSFHCASDEKLREVFLSLKFPHFLQLFMFIKSYLMKRRLVVLYTALSDETKKFHQDRYRDFFSRPKFSRPRPRLFFRPNIFETETFFVTKSFETETDTLKKLRKVSIPRSLETRCHILSALSCAILRYIALSCTILH